MIPERIADTTRAWANSAPLNTELTVDVAPGSPGLGGRDVLVIIRNPSAVTALTVASENTWTDSNGGATRYAKSTFFTAAATATNGDGEAFLVAGALVTGGCRISLKNTTALGVADGFTASVQVWQL
jgi:hypothetical protein